MDRLTTTWGLMLSVLCVTVVAYRNDLSSSTRHGCVWSTMEPNVKESSSTAPSLPSSVGGILNPGFSLNCNLRTLNNDFWNYTFNREQIEKTRVVRIKCSDKLFFESLLSPNQTLFQLKKLETVEIHSCKIRKVPSRVWSSLTKLKRLVLRTENTEWSGQVGLEFEQGAFEGLGQKLEYLQLSENNIFTLPEKVLCPLRSLVMLNVSMNRLSDVEELISARGESNCALNVENLDLSRNALRRVNSNAFSSMTRISHLYLQYNLISELSDTSFEQLNQIKLLNLSSNRLVALPPFVFKSNVNLQELYIQNNSISALSPQVFGKLERLLLIDLSRNSFTSQWIKEDLFQGLIRVVVINLSYNQLTRIDAALFKDQISLQALHLQNNQIDFVSPSAFQSLSNLHILDLTHNRLSYIDAATFSNLLVLRKLFLDHNQIRKMDPNSLNNCTTLEDLGLSRNLLEEVPAAFQSSSLGLLKTLDIGENKITRISNLSFIGMSQLYGLRIVENFITEIPDGFCSSVPKIRVLNFSHNKIRDSQIGSRAFKSCPDLTVLRLDNNALEELSPTLAPQLPSLLWFNVSGNKLKWTDYSLLPPTVEWVDLSYNSIESLTGPVAQTNRTLSNINNRRMPLQLRILDISHNKLEHLDQTTLPASLETLRVNHNQLKAIAPNTFILSTRIRRVELMGNQIQNLPLSALSLSPIPMGRTIPEFYLGDNPFLCCGMDWMLDLRNRLSLLRTLPRIMDLDRLTCTRMSTSVESSAIIPIGDASPRDFLCKYTSHCSSTCHCCEFECDCKSECSPGCTCYHDSGWSANIVECSNLQYESIPPRIPMDASEVYLDGNRLFELGSHIFIGKKNLRTLYLNNSQVELIKNKTFNGLKSLEILRLEDNLLGELHGYEFEDLKSLRELYLQNNLIRYVAADTFANLQFLQVLRLDGNQLVDFSAWQLSANGYLNSVMLSNNPFSCDCEFLNPFVQWVGSKTIVVDFALAKCQMNSEHHDPQQTILISSMCNSADITFNYEQLGNNEIETNNHILPMGGAEKVGGPQPPSENHLNLSRMETNADTFWALALCLTAFLIVIIVILAIFRQEIYYFLVQKEEGGSSLCSKLLSCLCCCRGKSGTHHPGKSGQSYQDQEKLFDAYFIYSRSDEDLIMQKIIPELEDPTTATTIPGNKFRLCLHYRDLCLSPDSPWNREMILSACDASKKVVIVLSKTFLNSEWSSSSHFRTSIQSAIGLHQKKIVFILLPDFDQGLSSISSELTSSKNSTVLWSDPKFWNKFKRLLPTPSSIASIPPRLNETAIVNYQTLPSNCDPSQLPYNLVMNPNLHHLQQLQQHQLRTNTHHYHHNIIPYQIPMPRNNSTLPPVPKHQIVLPANTNGLQQYNNQSLIHPIPSQLTPQHFGYSNNEMFHHPPNFQPVHFSSQQVVPPHSHSHTSSQISNNFSYPHHHQHQHQHSQMTEQNYSSSAVSSIANDVDELDHVYSTLDSPVEFSPVGNNGESGENCSRNNSKHTAQHSTSSGVSSGSDMTCGGESSSAVSPSSPIKNGILNKLNSQQQANNNGGNGKMYFV